MRSSMLRLVVLLLALSILPVPPASADQATPAAPVVCAVTLPSGERPPGENPDDDRWYGSGADDASLWLLMTWEGGVTTTNQTAGGYPLKLTFWRGEGSGDVAVTATGPDGATLPPGTFAPFRGTPIPGIHPIGGAVPVPGCWSFTATDGNDAITWTVFVQSSVAGCDVTSGAEDDGTIPETVIPGMMRGNPISPVADDYYGEDGLYVTLGSGHRHYPLDSGLVSGDGAVFDTFVWYREGDAEGELSITVESASGSPYSREPEISVPSGYGSRGVQASGITFPGPGCWEITGTSGDVSITFTLRLEIVPGRQGRS